MASGRSKLAITLVVLLENRATSKDEALRFFSRPLWRRCLLPRLVTLMKSVAEADGARKRS